MRNKKWTRILALCLAVVCLIGAVGAASLSYDLSLDGKTDVWDLQLAVSQGKTDTEKKAALAEALGGGDELHPNDDGVYEIYSVLGLYNMAAHATEGASFKLMRDVDMGGMNWTPIAAFKGTFDGGLHTISNVTIIENVGINQGFFAVSEHYTKNGETVQSEIKDLNLENVNITAAEGTQYIGLLVGSNKGKIVNCTTTGTITDNRTNLTADTYVGTVAGRNNDSIPAGTIASGTNLLTATAGTDNTGDKVEGLTSKVAMFCADLEEGSKARQFGIAGYTKDANIDTTMLWQDITNASSLKSETEQSLRQTVVDYMHTMGTVKWTPSQTITYTKDGNSTLTHSNIYIAGDTYTGVPYVGGYDGSYERFLSQMQASEDDQGRYVTVEGLEDGAKTGSEVSGFIQYMGNNCSIAIGWAWAQVTPSRSWDSEREIIYGGASGIGADFMVPNVYNTRVYGVQAVGGYQTLESDLTTYETAKDARDTQALIALNGGAAGMAKYYAKASMGDALVYDERPASNGYEYVNAHTRLLAADPVIIRGYNNAIDLDKSYVITHEQGDGLYDNDGKTETHKGSTYTVKYTSWRINYKYTLSTLLTKEGYNATTLPGCGWGYVPVTIGAYTSDVSTKKPYYNAYTEEQGHPVTLPNSGWYYSNYWNVSATMIITDANGTEVYNKTSYLLDRWADFYNIKLDEEFSDATDNLTDGQTYYCTISALASNGTVTTFVNNESFVCSK